MVDARGARAREPGRTRAAATGVSLIRLPIAVVVDAVADFRRGTDRTQTLARSTRDAFALTELADPDTFLRCVEATDGDARLVLVAAGRLQRIAGARLVTRRQLVICFAVAILVLAVALVRLTSIGWPIPRSGVTVR